MYKNIIDLSFSKLRKRDVKILASRVIEIVENNDPENLQIKEIFDLLVEQKPQIESLELRRIAHPLTLNIQKLRKQRVAFAQGIIDQMKTMENGEMTGMEEALIDAKPLVIQHLYGLRNCSDLECYDNITTFIGHTNNNLKLSTALETLNLTPLLDNLANVNMTIEALYGKRRKSNSERPKTKTSQTVAVIKTRLFDLIKQIEVAQIKNQELNYKPLIDDLNEEFAIMKAILKARASYNKKKAEKANSEANGVEKHTDVVVMSSPEKPSAFTQSTERMYPTNVEVDNNEENLEQLDIKKTVAVSGKQTRLPIVSDEA